MTPVTFPRLWARLRKSEDCCLIARMCPLPALQMIAVAIALVFSACAPARTPAGPTEERASPGDELPNMDELESEAAQGSARFPAGDPRTSKISALWMAHAGRLAQGSPAGSEAALLRAAHISSTALATDSCADPFNESCAELRVVYEQALEAIVRSARAAQWRAPDLAPSRYRLAFSGDAASLAGESWSLDLPNGTVGSDPQYRRSGVGFEAAACRPLQAREAGGASISLCSPITFVLTFDAPPEAARITATLAPLDAFRRDSVEISGREFSLAGDIGAGWRLLKSSARDPRFRGLACFGEPTEDMVIVVGLFGQAATAGKLPALLSAPVLDPALSASSGVCLFPLSAQRSPPAMGRELARLLRDLSDTIPAPLARRRARVFFVGEGKAASSALEALLGNVRRHTRNGIARRRRGPALSVEGILLVSPAGPPPELAMRASALGVPVHAAEQGARDALTSALAPLVEGHPPVESQEGSISELELSPIY